MRIDYSHGLTQEQAYEKVRGLLLDLQEKHADKISDPRTEWNPEHTVMEYSMAIMGNKTSGRVTLRDGQVSLEGKLPFMVRMFSSRIEEMIRVELDASFS